MSITDSASCQGTSSAISGRSETDPSSGTDFEFVYSTKYTPYFEELRDEKGFDKTDITITGDGKNLFCKQLPFLCLKSEFDTRVTFSHQFSFTLLT